MTAKRWHAAQAAARRLVSMPIVPSLPADRAPGEHGATSRARGATGRGGTALGRFWCTLVAPEPTLTRGLSFHGVSRSRVHGDADAPHGAGLRRIRRSRVHLLLRGAGPVDDALGRGAPDARLRDGRADVPGDERAAEGGRAERLELPEGEVVAG